MAGVLSWELLNDSFEGYAFHQGPVETNFLLLAKFARFGAANSKRLATTTTHFTPSPNQ